MLIAILLYDRFTALDAIGPYEVLGRLPGATVRFVASQPGPVVSDVGSCSIVADDLDEVRRPDVVVVPGGQGDHAARRDHTVLDWVREVHEHTTWTTSVCTGSLVLAEAGLLDGLPATTHWLAMDILASLGARPVEERVVETGKILCAAGVSAGIDMALTLAARIAGEPMGKAIQLGIEYDPQPPFDSGSPATADSELVALLRGNADLVLGARD